MGVSLTVLLFYAEVIDPIAPMWRGLCSQVWVRSLLSSLVCVCPCVSVCMDRRAPVRRLVLCLLCEIGGAFILTWSHRLHSDPLRMQQVQSLCRHEVTPVVSTRRRPVV